MPNLFYVVGCIEKFNQQFSVKLTHLDINYIRNCCSNLSSGNCIKVLQGQLRRISCLPSTNRNSREEFIKVIGSWYAVEITYLASSNNPTS